MNFANPLLLAGLAAAVLPVVIHLLGRARAPTVPWGATMLLDCAATDGHGGGRWRDRALLLIRCLVIAILALALARPVDPMTGPAAGGAGQSVVLVIDTSPSMAHPEANTNRLELARWTALDRLGKLRQGDQAGLVVLGPSWNMDLAPTPDLQSVASQVASLWTGPLAADLAEGERRARAMLADAGVDGGEIDLIADRQRTTWEPLADSPAVGGPRVVAMPIGTPQRVNRRIESIEPLDVPIIAGQPARFAVTIRNESDGPQGDLLLRLSFGTSEDVGPVAVDGEGVTRAVRTVLAPAAGPAVVTATLPQDGLPGDDALRITVDILPRPRVRTLSAVPIDFGTAYDVVPLDAEPLADGDIAVVNDFAPDFTSVAEIERHVATGGTLILAAGPSLGPDAWNTRLWKGGFGLAPAAAGDIARPKAPPRLRLAPGGGETTLQSQDNEPLVVERPFGRGRVIAVAVPLGQLADPSAWVLRLIPRSPSRNIYLGVPIETIVRTSTDRPAIIVRPDGRVERVPLVWSGNDVIVRYSRTDLPGRYAVRVGSGGFVDWFVRPEAAEADARMLDDVGLAALAGRVTLATNDPPVRREVEPATWLLATVAVLLGGEMLLAHRFLMRRGAP